MYTICFRRTTNIDESVSENESDSDFSGETTSAVGKKRGIKEHLPTLPPQTPKVPKREDACSQIISYLKEKRSEKAGVTVGGDTHDADELFCKSITETIRGLNGYQKSQAKVHIMQVLMEVQFNKAPAGYKPITPLEQPDLQFAYSSSQAPAYQMSGPSTSAMYGYQ